MNCPICNNLIGNNDKQCINCGYVVPYNQQQINQQINANYNQSNAQSNYGYQPGNNNNQPYYNNNQPYYNNNQPNYFQYNQTPKKKDSMGIILATILIGLGLCCGAPLTIGMVGLDFITRNEDVLDKEKEHDEYNPDFGYGGQREEWEHDEANVIDNDDLGLVLGLVSDSVVTEKGNLTFELNMFNYSPELVDISISEAWINDTKTYDFDSEAIRLGSNTVVDGYDQTRYGQTFELRNNIGDIDSFKVKFKIYYPNLDKTFETTEFYFTKSGFTYEANVLNSEKIKQSNENKNNNSSIDNNVGFNYYGNDKVGYVILDGVWANFIDIEGSSLTSTTVQYSNGARILTMDMYNNTTASICGDNLYRSLASNGEVKSVEVVDMGSEGSSEYYQVLAEYYDGTLWTVSFITDFNTNNTLYFSYETYMGGADTEEFLKEAYEILSTYSANKGQEI